MMNQARPLSRGAGAGAVGAPLEGGLIETHFMAGTRMHGRGTKTKSRYCNENTAWNKGSTGKKR